MLLGKREMNSRAYCASFNFKGADQQKKVGSLSGGERNRVHLAKMLKSGANVLLLDEPTNDLDVDTLRALEEALEDFAGCAVIISHDRWFLDRIATHILAFEGDSHVEWFEGNFQDYEADKMRRLGQDFDHSAPPQIQEVHALAAGRASRVRPRHLPFCAACAKMQLRRRPRVSCWNTCATFAAPSTRRAKMCASLSNASADWKPRLRRLRSALRKCPIGSTDFGSRRTN